MTVDNHDYASVTMDLHPTTRALVFDFANALGGKLSAAEKKYGRSDDWACQDWESECRAKLMQHIAKGDPLDVAAYCAFMWSRGWSTAVPERDISNISNGAHDSADMTGKTYPGELDRAYSLPSQNGNTP